MPRRTGHSAHGLDRPRPRRPSHQASGSKSPRFAPARKDCHSVAGKARTGPCGSLESRTATARPASATSTQAPCPVLLQALRQTSRRAPGSIEDICGHTILSLSGPRRTCRVRAERRHHPEQGANTPESLIPVRPQRRRYQIGRALCTQGQSAQLIKNLPISLDVLLSLQVDLAH